MTAKLFKTIADRRKSRRIVEEMLKELEAMDDEEFQDCVHSYKEQIENLVQKIDDDDKVISGLIVDNAGKENVPSLDDDLEEGLAFLRTTRRALPKFDKRLRNLSLPKDPVPGSSPPLDHEADELSDDDAPPSDEASQPSQSPTDEVTAPPKDPSPPPVALPSANAANVLPVPPLFPHLVNMPRIECPKFDGTSKDKMAFKNFWAEFTNCMEAYSCTSDTLKLKYLKSFTSGKAFQLIRHLSLTDGNFNKALELLQKEYLQIENIITEYVGKIMTPKLHMKSMSEVESFLGERRAIAYDLQEHGYDFLEKGSAAEKAFSWALFTSMPANFQLELIRRTGTDHPTANGILEHYRAIANTLERMTHSPVMHPKPSDRGKLNLSEPSKPSHQQQLTSKPGSVHTPSPSTLENFGTSSSAVAGPKASSKGKSKTQGRSCDFCKGPHSKYWCPAYATQEARHNRCIELSLCTRCTSPNHQTVTCPGKDDRLKFACNLCGSHSHAATMCSKGPPPIKTHFCVNLQRFSQGGRFLLPMLSLTFIGTGNRFRRVRCLLDTGSQQTYLSKEVVQYLKCDQAPNTGQFKVNTFLGSATRELGESLLKVQIPGCGKSNVIVLTAPDVRVSLDVAHLSTAANNIVQAGFRLAEPSLTDNGEPAPALGILGVDLIQMFPDLRIVECMGGSAFFFNGGVIPFGDVEHFLLPNQATHFYQTEVRDERPKISGPPSAHSSATDERTPQNSRSSASSASTDERALQTAVNFVLSPKKTYYSPLEYLFPDSAVEQGLEAMFSIDALGHNDESESDFDRRLIDKFKAGISLQGGKYHVELPWKDDILENVPPNHKVALAVLNRVTKSLSQQEMLVPYQEVFLQQLDDGIIEEINVHPDDYPKYTWIPHRPVIKTEENATTKIRPVFNCSLKTNGSPSLNEAAYAGVNLMRDLTQLSLYFRSNQFTLMSDIKQAFLQICLAKEADKNRFCFFMRVGDRLVTYRYKTLLFGFNASPFILNYVLKHHSEQLAQDDVSNILRNNLYVDNMLVTSNSLPFLKNAYHETQRRLEEGGFILRSWNSNSPELQSIMSSQGNQASHGNSYEKVLGMKYQLHMDSLQLSDLQLDQSAKTKRSVLAQVASVFDPLGLYLPVTNKGKFLLSELWAAKYQWDDVLPSDTQQKWSRHCADLLSLSTIFFPRSCVNEDSTNSIVVFTDASKSGYGFAVYNVVDGESNIVYAKSRVAPIKPRTLPVLELLGVHHALKSLPTVIASFPKVKFQDVTVAVDSQVVLQWLLADSITTKSVFTRNKVKDIQLFKQLLLQDHKLSIQFKYVSSAENPCDLLTRGLSFKDFAKQLHFWRHGPHWLPKFRDSWPDYTLGCLSPASKRLAAPTSVVNAVVNVNTALPPPYLVNLERFSCYRKALRGTIAFFRCWFKWTKKDGNPVSCARLLLFTEMQKACFPEELAYLSSPDKPKAIPPLVNHLNLFLDDKGLIRSRGRIAKSLHVSPEVQNPILLGKDHKLTNLLVKFFHNECKHLGVPATLNRVRLGGFWIPRMRQAVKNALADCALCKRYNSLAYPYPRMTNLPKSRVNLVKAFEHTGVDYTGHLWINNEKGESAKMYLVVFTCLSVRAVHIEIVPDMSTEQFIFAFMRFTNVHGIPSHLYSDNAKSFVQGTKILKAALITDAFKSQFAAYDIQHVTIPVYSAWVGATWERMIYTIKSCLYKTIGRARVTYFELLTVISDVQNAVNSRPLTYRSSDNEIDAITPNCFLKADPCSNRALKASSEPIWEIDSSPRNTLMETLASRDDALEHFKEQWYDSYLLELRASYRNLHQTDWKDKISVDDIVLVKLPNRTRPHWVLGRVLELFRGSDNKVRSVNLKRGDGVTAQHSICHLYPLELSLSQSPRALALPPVSGEPDFNEPGPSGYVPPAQPGVSDQNEPGPSGYVPPAPAGDFNEGERGSNSHVPPISGELSNNRPVVTVDRPPTKSVSKKRPTLSVPAECPSRSIEPRPRRLAYGPGRKKVRQWAKRLRKK